MYEYIEYPKALYFNGQYAVVNDKYEETAMNADGWTDWNADNDRKNAPEVEEPKKRGPKPKTQVEA